MDKLTKQFNLLGNCGKLILKDNVLAVLSDSDLTTVSSAIYKGGFKKVKAILNVQVPEKYSDRRLHDNPQSFIMESAKKLGLAERYVGMVTAAAIEKFSLVSKKAGDLAVSVIATAVDPAGDTCSHAESAGEMIEVLEIEGTINIMVVIDGNPTESCLVSTLITATEAKTAALRELDIRSRYSGDEATGTITDAMVVAETNRGAPIVYGGPASKLGQLVGYCTRKAVKEAVMKANECMPCRSIMKRLRERHLPIEKLSSELSKVGGIEVDEKTLVKILRNEPLLASFLMAAAKIDEDVKKELIPSEFKNIDALSKNFGSLLSKQSRGSTKTPSESANKEDYSSASLPPFLKHVLINLLKTALSKEETENLK
ncbi:MAG: adenosylcobinamide amidohydrolase [Candidatus Bathyarchaeota archaeon]|nr:MAG: adenosylcobinamide amidohydrolase [Candidatus Bathyarchaeota archaeon]